MTPPKMEPIKDAFLDAEAELGETLPVWEADGGVPEMATGAKGRPIAVIKALNASTWCPPWKVKLGGPLHIAA
jgi:hypothetical protein